MNFEIRQGCGICPPSRQNKNEVHVPTANDGEHLPALITFTFSATITHTLEILTSGDFYPGRNGGHVVPR